MMIYSSQKLLFKESAPFHILITSYQLVSSCTLRLLVLSSPLISPFPILCVCVRGCMCQVVQDVKYFHRVKWQYMILDEAQAIKSSSSMRWKVLLSFSCRNRLLLTGTPIQNTMQEVSRGGVMTDLQPGC